MGIKLSINTEADQVPIQERPGPAVMAVEPLPMDVDAGVLETGEYK